MSSVFKGEVRRINFGCELGCKGVRVKTISETIARSEKQRGEIPNSIALIGVFVAMFSTWAITSLQARSDRISGAVMSNVPVNVFPLR